MKKALLLVCVLAPWGCGEVVSETHAVETMEAAGFTQVHVTGKHSIAPAYYGCSDGDRVGFDVTAKNPAGKVVQAKVCCGVWLKGCTVRY